VASGKIAQARCGQDRTIKTGDLMAETIPMPTPMTLPMTLGQKLHAKAAQG
jgi:hypothetical protein